ncbi:MBL fold metallo-hydrolase [Bacillus tianshenii]|nr:MBL fold metallo-hydrolase [Bacillus tianshenii]
MIKRTTFSSGHCTQLEKITNTAGRWKNVAFPALYFLLQHPTKGNILFDTGYATHFIEGTKVFPYSIYARLTPVVFDPMNGAVEQVRKLGVEPEQVENIFISHFHADHVAGLRDFPKATFVCSKECYEFVKGRNGISALKQAFIPSLLPYDFEERMKFIEDCPRLEIRDEDDAEVKSLQDEFGVVYDLFGDRSFLSIAVPGHAKGQHGLFFKEDGGYTFLIADATWDSGAYRELQLPSRLANLVLQNRTQFEQTLQKIHHFHKRHPDVRIIPSHCKEELTFEQSSARNRK